MRIRLISLGWSKSVYLKFSDSNVDWWLHLAGKLNRIYSHPIVFVALYFYSYLLAIIAKITIIIREGSIYSLVKELMLSTNIR